MSEKVKIYITKETFTELLWHHIKYEGYVIGEGYAFIDGDVNYQFLDPFLRVKKVGDKQYLDTSYEEYLNSFVDDISKVTSIEQLTNGDYTSQQPLNNWSLPQKPTQVEINAEKDRVSNYLRNQGVVTKKANSSKVSVPQKKSNDNSPLNASNASIVNNGLQATISSLSELANQAEINAFEQMFKVKGKVDKELVEGALKYEAELVKNYQKVKPYVNIGVDRMTKMDIENIYRGNPYREYSYLKRYKIALEPYLKTVKKMPSVPNVPWGVDVSKVLDKTKGFQRESINTLTYGDAGAKSIKIIKSAGAKVAIPLQVLCSGYSVMEAYDTNNYRKGRVATKAGLDIAVTIGLCALGGPVGWGIGIVYIGADFFGVQDWAIDNAYYLFNPEEKAREEKYK